jgi:hypothetical protein
MNDETIDDALLREFLLGKVNDEDRERIEGLFLIDSQAKERVLAVEQDLIEDYLEGTLTTADSERFVSRYAQTDEQRRRLRITRSIKDWAIAASSQTVPAQRSVWSGLRGRPWLKPAFVIPIAMTAMIAIVVAAIWLSRRSEHSAIEQELAQLNTSSNLREGPVSLELSPITVRSAASQNQLNIQSESGFVEIRLLLIQKERYQSYQATIGRLENESFLVPNLQPESDGKAIRLKLPARILTRGTYQINLSGIAANGPTDFSEEYQFTVDH